MAKEKTASTTEALHQTMVRNVPLSPKKKRAQRLRTIKENYPFFIMLFPAVLVVFLFNYLPIYGVLIAFQDFMPGDPIFSEFTRWVGFDNFTRFFHDVQFSSVFPCRSWSR